MFIYIDEHNDVCVNNDGFVRIDGELDWVNDTLVLSSN